MALERIAWPNCDVSITLPEQEVLFPYGKAVLKLEGKLSGKKQGSFKCEMGGREVDANSLNEKVKVEYGNELAKLVSEANFSFNSVTGKAELTFKCGWKFTNCSYQLKPPNTHVFSFYPQAVKLSGLSGEVKPVVEVTPKDERTNPDPLLFKIPESNFNFNVSPDMRQTPTVLVSEGAAVAVAYWYVVEMLKDAAADAVGRLSRSHDPSFRPGCSIRGPIVLTAAGKSVRARWAIPIPTLSRSSRWAGAR